MPIAKTEQKTDKRTNYDYLIKDSNSGYRCLAAMVIKQAVDDYKTVLKRTKGLKKSKRREDCIEFFKSDFCYNAIGIDGEVIMKQIEREVINEKVKEVQDKHTTI